MASFPVPFNTLADTQKAFAERTTENRKADLPVANPTRSFWLEQPNVSPSSREGSEGKLPADADICIIGSGISGVSTAYHLAKLAAKESPSRDGAESLRVVVLEAREFCSGATGRNGGHLTVTPFPGFCDYARLHGEEEALRELAIQRYTVDKILKIVHELGQEDHVDLVSNAHVDILFTEEELISTKGDYEAAQAAGADLSHVEWLSREQMKSQYGVDHPGVRYPGNNLWPLKLVSVLFEQASQATPQLKLSLHTCTPVLEVSALDDTHGTNRRWNLKTARGDIACSYVVHATNAYASHLLPHMQGPIGIVPTRGQVVAMRAAVPAEKITTSSWLANEGFEYWFPRPVKSTGEYPLIILGGAREAVKPDYEYYETDDSVVSPVAGRALRGFLPATFPGLYEEGREPEMEWTGIMGFTRTGDPFVGPVTDAFNPEPKAYVGQYITAGFSGHGMPRAFACAEAIAGMIHADLTRQPWTIPPWLPVHYFTTTAFSEPQQGH